MSVKKIVMIVDDEEDLRKTTKNILEKNGYEVIEAVNGDDCLKKIASAKQKPDLILMDIMMPGTKVNEIVPQMPNIKIVYLSVVRLSDAEKEGLTKSKNIVGFIQKPFDIEYLLEEVKKLLV